MKRSSSRDKTKERASTRSTRSGRNHEDDGNEAPRPPARPGATAVASGNDAATKRKARDFPVVENVENEEPDLGVFATRDPEEVMETSNNNKKTVAEDENAGEDEANIGAFAVLGQNVEHRQVGQASPPTGDASLYSGPTASLQHGTQYQHLAVASQVADSQVHDEVRRALAGSSGADPEIHAEIDAHVRRILAESAVPAENVVLAVDDGPPVSGGPPPGPDVSYNQDDKSRRNKYLIIAALILVVIAIAVGVAVPLATSSASSSSSTDPGEQILGPTPSPTSQGPSPAPTPAGPTWLQLGNDIEGIEPDGVLGNVVSISQDGSVVAASAPQSSAVALNSGYVSVQQYNTATSAWEPRGQLLNGTRQYEYFGWSVSLADKAERLAVTADGSNEVFVYQFDTVTSTWKQLGQVLTGLTQGGRFGVVVSLSGDGNVLATATKGANPEYIRIYRHDATTSQWTQFGQDIIMPASAGDVLTGYALSLSSGGSVLAVGADETPINGTGVAQVYQYEDSSDSWLQLGEDLRGVDLLDRFGFAVSLNSIGTLLAVGAPAEKDVDSGYVRIFEYSTAGWGQVGPDITGGVGDEFGYSVSLADGMDTVAVGSRSHSASGRPFAGKASVFEYSALEFKWVQIGQDLIGESGTDEFGCSVSLSGDGSIVAAGGRFHDAAGGNDSGHVKVYNLVELMRRLQV